jgi:hypothetical protein
MLRACGAEENSGWAHLMGSSGFAIDPRSFAGKPCPRGPSKRENKPNGVGFVF